MQAAADLATRVNWESIAVVLALAYPLLAARESIFCWHCGFASSAIFTSLLWHAALPMQSALYVFYMAMAVYGWHQWRRGGRRRGARIHSLPPRRHLLLGGLALSLAALSGALLDRQADTAWPYVDAFITWASIVATWMMAKKILENWLYWLLIDSVCIPLYLSRGLRQTAWLFVVYLVLSLYGYLAWRKLYRRQE